MKKILLIGLITMLFFGGAFAIGNVCENIHVSTTMQDRYFGGNYGQEVCISPIQTNQYFVNYNNASNWQWVLHECKKPKEPNNLLRFFYCGGLN